MYVCVCVVCGVVMRLQVLSFRLQAGDARYRNGLDCFKQILTSEGIPGLYRGLGGNLIASPPASAIWWLAYENFKKSFADLRKTPSQRHNYPAQFAAGFAAQVIATIVMNPFNVVMVRYQTQTSAHRNQSFSSIVRSTVREEGMVAFTRGLMPKTMMMAPISALSSLLYEFVMTKSKKQPHA